MKYVRTKDKIYEVSEYNDYATHKRKGSTLVEKDRTSYIKNENIIAQSENIEELCDEFVYVVNDKIHKLILGEHSLKEAIEETKKYSKRTIYGAVWTGWGLKYVAKMNDGELVLI